MRCTDRSPDELWVCHLGVVPYGDGLVIQEQVRAGRQAGELADALLLLEHPPVYTRGRRSGAEDLPFGEDFYRAKGIDVFDTDRGGKLTYHGPGQLVGYPIMGVEDVGRHLRTMEGAIVGALAEQGLLARSRHDEGIDYTGVWVEDRKIASIGVHVSRGVSTHGFAVNVENDLRPFTWVTPCGLPDVTMTSLARELGPPPGADRTRERVLASRGAPRSSEPAASWPPVAGRSLACFRKRMAHAFSRAHGRRQRLVTPQRLGIATTNAISIKAVSPPMVAPVPA